MERTAHTEARDFGPILALDSVTVSLTRNEENDQLYVLIDTDGNDETDEHDSPRMQIDLNDATLYDVGPDAGRVDYIPARDTITRIQNMRNEFGVPAGDNEQTREDFLVEMEGEDYGRYMALGDVLNVLHILARGGTPAQGAPDPIDDYSPENTEDISYKFAGDE